MLTKKQAHSVQGGTALHTMKRGQGQWVVMPFYKMPRDSAAGD